MKKIVVQILALILLPLTVGAQACCSGGTPLAGNLGLRPVSGGNFYVDLTYDYNTQRTLLNGSRLLADNRRERTTHAVLSRAAYGITDRFAVAGILSWINEREIVSVAGRTNQFAATGIGDAILIAQYEAVQQEYEHLLLGAGVKFPMGRTDIRDPETGLLLNPDLQPGSGSWDLVLSALFEKQHVLKDNLTLIAELTARMNTEADRFGGRQAYQFGREYRANLGLRDRYLIGAQIFDPSLNVLYRHTEKDRIDGNDVPNTGGHWIHILPGINWQASPAFAINGSVSIPLYRNLTGTQLTTTNRFTLTLSYQKTGRPAVIPVDADFGW